MNSLIAWVAGLISPTCWRLFLNQKVPFGPGVILPGLVLPDGRANELKASVVGLNIPMAFTLPSENQRLPSGPAVIALGPAPAVGIVNKRMASVAGLMLPIALAPDRRTKHRRLVRP